MSMGFARLGQEPPPGNGFARLGENAPPGKGFARLGQEPPLGNGFARLGEKRPSKPFTVPRGRCSGVTDAGSPDARGPTRKAK